MALTNLCALKFVDYAAMILNDEMEAVIVVDGSIAGANMNVILQFLLVLCMDALP